MPGSSRVFELSFQLQGESAGTCAENVVCVSWRCSASLASVAVLACLRGSENALRFECSSAESCREENKKESEANSICFIAHINCTVLGLNQERAASPAACQKQHRKGRGQPGPITVLFDLHTQHHLQDGGREGQCRQGGESAVNKVKSGVSFRDLQCCFRV
jgi:hypothetical protein